MPYCQADFGVNNAHTRINNNTKYSSNQTAPATLEFPSALLSTQIWHKQCLQKDQQTTRKTELIKISPHQPAYGTWENHRA